MTDAQPVDLDLDADRPQAFKLQGEVFRVKQLSYKRFGEVDEAFMAAIRDLTATTNGSEPESEDEEVEQQTAEESAAEQSYWEKQLDAFADFAEANIVDEDVPKFRDLRARDAQGLQSRDVNTLRKWLWEAQTGRPMRQAEDSSPGPGSNEASSKDASGSPGVVR